MRRQLASIQRCCNLFQLSGLLFRSHVAWFVAECGRCWLCDTRNVTAEKQSTKLEQITAPLQVDSAQSVWGGKKSKGEGSIVAPVLHQCIGMICQPYPRDKVNYAALRIIRVHIATAAIPMRIPMLTSICSADTRGRHNESRLPLTPHQKRTQDRFGIPATIPVPYEPPGSGLSENMKMKKIYRGTLTSDFSKPSFFIEIHVD